MLCMALIRRVRAFPIHSRAYTYYIQHYFSHSQGVHPKPDIAYAR